MPTKIVEELIRQVASLQADMDWVKLTLKNFMRVGVLIIAGIAVQVVIAALK